MFHQNLFSYRTVKVQSLSNTWNDQAKQLFLNLCFTHQLLVGDFSNTNTSFERLVFNF